MLTMKDLRVGDIMTPMPSYLGERDSLADAVRFLTENDFSGAPVVGGDGVLLSVLSTTDLVRGLAPLALWDKPPEPEEVWALVRRGIGTLVTHSPIVCYEQTSLAEACRLMINNRVHRVVVMRDKKPVGILSAIDAVRTIACLDDLEVTSPPREGEA
jgi:CBS domain-containing protein